MRYIATLSGTTAVILNVRSAVILLKKSTNIPVRMFSQLMPTRKVGDISYTISSVQKVRGVLHALVSAVKNQEQITKMDCEQLNWVVALFLVINGGMSNRSIEVFGGLGLIIAGLIIFAIRTGAQVKVMIAKASTPREIKKDGE